MDEQAAPTTRQVGLKYGLYIGLVLIIFSLIMQLTGLALNPVVSSLPYLILLAGIIIAHREFKNEGAGTMTFGQGISIGVVLSFIAGLLSGIFSYIYLTFIDRSMMDEITEQQMQAMADKGLSEEEIEQAMEFADKFLLKLEIAVPFGIIFMVFLGLIMAVIVSLFTKTE